MRTPAKNAVAEHRRRLRQRGLARIELRAPKEDAPLLREVACALADPVRASGARLLLREHFSAHHAKGLKALLAAAPLDLELDFNRTYDIGREIEF